MSSHALSSMENNRPWKVSFGYCFTSYPTCVNNNGSLTCSAPPFYFVGRWDAILQYSTEWVQLYTLTWPVSQIYMVLKRRIFYIWIKRVSPYCTFSLYIDIGVWSYQGKPRKKQRNRTQNCGEDSLNQWDAQHLCSMENQWFLKVCLHASVQERLNLITNQIITS